LNNFDLLLNNFNWYNFMIHFNLYTFLSVKHLNMSLDKMVKMNNNRLLSFNLLMLFNIQFNIMHYNYKLNNFTIDFNLYMFLFVMNMIMLVNLNNTLSQSFNLLMTFNILFNIMHYNFNNYTDLYPRFN
jgi:hypothetical protein